MSDEKKQKHIEEEEEEEEEEGTFDSEDDDEETLDQEEGKKLKQKKNNLELQYVSIIDFALNLQKMMILFFQANEKYTKKKKKVVEKISIDFKP